MYWRTSERSKADRDGIAGCFPGLEATDQSGALETAGVDDLRRTGAGMFRRSGSVEDQFLIWRKTRDCRAELTDRN